jgi:hypothetical protein
VLRALSRNVTPEDGAVGESAGTGPNLGVEFLLVKSVMRSELLPPTFPADLAAGAFAAGGEVAWPLALATTAVSWLAAHGYAVLGTELWVLQSGATQSLPRGPSGKPEVHGNDVSHRGEKEEWTSYVARAAAETLAYMHSFRAEEIVEPGDLYFNVVWVDELDYEKMGSR